MIFHGKPEACLTTMRLEESVNKHDAPQLGAIVGDKDFHTLIGAESGREM